MVCQYNSSIVSMFQKRRGGQERYRATTLKLRRAKLDVYLVVDSLLAMGLPFGLPFSRPFNFDESIGRPLISAAMAKRWHGKSKVFGV